MKPSQTELFLLSSVLNDYLFNRTDSRRTITDKGIKKLVDLYFKIGDELIPLGEIPRSEIIKKQSEVIAKFQRNVELTVVKRKKK